LVEAGLATDSDFVNTIDGSSRYIGNNNNLQYTDNLAYEAALAIAKGGE
jgi:hypothetical protein